MISNSFKIRLLFLSCVLLVSSVAIAQPSVNSGKTLFKNYCASCHAKDMKSGATGPALGGTAERWADYPREDLYEWIWNSQKLIAAGHPKAVELWNEFKPTVMTGWPNLSVDEIESILLYVECMEVGGPECTPKKAVVADSAEPAESSKAGLWTYALLAILLAALALFLARVIINLNKLIAAKDGEVYEGKSIYQSLTSKTMVSVGIFILVLLGGYTTVNRAIELGRQQDYTPDQPVAFSHETHAGLHKIECQYCHDGARRSKHAIIPAANTCMNCHQAIKVGSTHGTAELTKIYASVGYNPSDNSYLEDYESMSQEDVAAIYKKWIADNYIEENELADLDVEGEKMVKSQWDNIVSSLTNEQKTKVQGAIEWTRIHNLPDHVYFSHAQHVQVGKLECQQCHGEVQEMPVVGQHAPLSMGWCVNCHRKTEVQFTDNDYYKSYTKYHDEIKSGKREKVTVEDIGGLDCQKCHY